jgi:hypothetical protein
LKDGRSFFNRLKLSMQGRWGELYLVEKNALPEIPLPEMITRLLTLDDEFWSEEYSFSRDPLRRLISGPDRKFLSKAARECGIYTVQNVRTVHGEQNPRQTAEQLGLSIKKIQGADGSGRIRFAEFREPDEIRIYEDCLNRIDSVAEEAGENETLFSGAEDALIAHELFHFLEIQQKDTIFTQTHYHILPPFLFFKRRVKPLCLSEIAAMAFVKEYLHLSYSPYIYDLLLTYCFNKTGAQRLYQHINCLITQKIKQGVSYVQD